MKNNCVTIIACVLAITIGLSACGSGNPPSSATTASGKFVDAPVEGLKYVSGNLSGFTGANGEFTYEVGLPVTFSVGGIVVGQAQGASVITPIELVKAANPDATVTTGTPEVVRIAQFLLTASSVTATGIKIDPAVTSACAAHSLNISSAALSAFTTVISQIATTAGNRPVTSTTDARNHIVASMNGLSAGTVVLPPASATGSGQYRPPGTNSVLYKYVGSRQCTGGGVSLTAMQSQLTDAGIQVLAASCGSDGLFYTAVCGAADGRIGIFEVPAMQAQDAILLGFAQLSELPDATRVTCR